MSHNLDRGAAPSTLSGPRPGACGRPPHDPQSLQNDGGGHPVRRCQPRPSGSALPPSSGTNRPTTQNELPMNQFDNNADRLVAIVGEGLTLTDACKQISLPYNTARKWVSAGRADPGSKYGDFVRDLDAARTLAESDGDEDHEPGPVESEVQHLIAGRKLDGEGRIFAVQARMLARSVDTLAQTKGGSAGLALASVSRRLEECIAAIRLQPGDWLTELQERVAMTRAEARGRYEAEQARGNGAGES